VSPRFSLVVGACLVFGLVGCQAQQPPTASPPAAQILDTTCGEWMAMTEPDRRTTIGAIIDADGLMRGVRLAQRMDASASRDQLVAAAVTSIDKNCELMGLPAMSVAELAGRLYR
jgi:hypothetical protein